MIVFLRVCAEACSKPSLVSEVELFCENDFNDFQPFDCFQEWLRLEFMSEF